MTQPTYDTPATRGMALRALCAYAAGKFAKPTCGRGFTEAEFAEALTFGCEEFAAYLFRGKLDVQPTAPGVPDFSVDLSECRFGAPTPSTF